MKHHTDHALYVRVITSSLLQRITSLARQSLREIDPYRIQSLHAGQSSAFLAVVHNSLHIYTTQYISAHCSGAELAGNGAYFS